MTDVSQVRIQRARPLPHRPRRAHAAGRPPALRATDQGQRPNRFPTSHAGRAATRIPRSVVRCMVGLALLVAVAAAPVLVSATNTPAAADAVAQTDEIASAPGHLVLGESETVWELVTPHRPEGTDIQTWVHQVIEVNSFDVTAVPPGTVVHLP